MKKTLLLCAVAALFTLAACIDKPEVGSDDPVSNDNPANAYSVSADKQVRMADGNLQYQASTSTWRIAPNAWDAALNDNLNISATYDGWFDHFGWATSGYMDYFPFTTQNQSSAYYHDGSIAGTHYDWGVHNEIVNGQAIDPAGTWRTLTNNEWEYLLLHRNASTVSGTDNARFLMATVCGQTGLLLFPDAFQYPATLATIDGSDINATIQYELYQYNESQWNELRQAGCVFLPAAGCHNAAGNSMVSLNYLGCYWASTYLGESELGLTAAQVWFSPYICEMGAAALQHGRSVRLAKDIQ